MTLRTDLLHSSLSGRIVLALVCDCVRQIVRQAFGWIVRHTRTVDPAHVASGTSGDEHITGSQSFRRGIQVEQPLLCLEHDPVLGLFVDFDLRVIRSHVALGTGAGQARNSDRTRMTRVTRRAIANRAIRIRAADGVALLTSAGHSGSAFQLYKRMRRATGATRLIRLREVHLLGSEPLLAVNSSPRRGSMAASQELLIDSLVAAAAIAGGKLGRDDESVMILLFLAGRRLMALETVDPFSRVRAHLVLVDDRVLGTGVAFGALTGGTH